jgi:hypothetical protein
MQISIVGRTDSLSALMFRCQKRNLDVRIPLSKGTWFENCHISIEIHVCHQDSTIKTGLPKLIAIFKFLFED